MKKIVLICTVIGIMLLFAGCSNNVKDTEENENSEIVSEDLNLNNNSEVSTDEKLKEALTLCFEEKVDSQEIIDKVEKLIFDEHQFIFKVEKTGVEENAEQIEYEGGPYFLVSGMTWETYEDLAKCFYSNSYVENTFTPTYTMGTRFFVEVEGKLYRAPVASIISPLMEDSITMWKIADGLYYVKMLREGDGIVGVQVYIVGENKDKEYGFEILNKYHLN